MTPNTDALALVLENAERDGDFRGPPLRRAPRRRLPVALPVDLPAAASGKRVALGAVGVHGESRDEPMVVVRVELDGDLIIETHRPIALGLVGMDAGRLRVVGGDGEIKRLLVRKDTNFGALGRRLPVLGNPEFARDRSIQPNGVKKTVDEGCDRRRSDRQFAGVAQGRRNGGLLSEGVALIAHDEGG